MRELFEETAKITGIPVEVVEKVIKSFMMFVKRKITSVKYRDLDSWDRVKTNFSIPGFGKLVVKSKTLNRLKYGKIKC